MSRSFFTHLHPHEVTQRALHPLTTLGLGILSIACFIALTVTGLLLMFYYIPTLEDAYRTTTDIQHVVSFGAYLRALHRVAGHAMVIAVTLHLLRVLFCGAFLDRRQNWLIGLALFGLTMTLAFTGYLLPADQLAYWAVTVSTNLLDHLPLIGGAAKRVLLGGGGISDATMVRFYMLHVALFPCMLIGFIVWHLWRLRRDGGLVPSPSRAAPATVPARPHLLLREVTLVLGALALLSMIAAIVDAPLGAAPDIHHPSNPEKTPWYFLFLQEMVSYTTVVGGFLFPLTAGGLLIALPFVGRRGAVTGRWFGSRAERIALWVSLCISLLSFVVFEVLFHQSGIAAHLSALPTFYRDLFNPATGMLALALVVFAAVYGRTRSPKVGAMAAVTVLLVAVAGFGVMGWCRGPGWVFYLPFEEWPNV